MFTKKMKVSDDCNVALGMESGKIKDDQISASSTFDEQSVGPASSRYFSNIVNFKRKFLFLNFVLF